MTPDPTSLQKSQKTGQSHELKPPLQEFDLREVDFNRIAREYIKNHRDKRFDGARSLFLQASIMEEAVKEYEVSYALRETWGGFREDRSELWRGSYFSGNFKHAGIDVNLPQAAPVYAPCAGQVLLVDEDDDQSGGWGKSIAFEPREQCLRKPVILIFAHLDAESVKEGDAVAGGALLARIGSPKMNGGWWPHLHIQAVEREFYRKEMLSGFEELDGYYLSRDQRKYEEIYLDPEEYLRMMDCQRSK